jgi:hypothetical protein
VGLPHAKLMYDNALNHCRRYMVWNKADIGIITFTLFIH